MNRWFSLALAAFVIAMVTALCEKDEPVYDFIDSEDLPLDEKGYWNGSDGSGGFESGNAFFLNTYTDWGGGIKTW